MAGQERQLTLRFLAEPADQNFGGKVHGGAVMKWIDLAAYACAAGWCGKYCITAYAGGIRFVQPILVGNIVEVGRQRSPFRLEITLEIMPANICKYMNPAIVKLIIL